MTQHFVPVSAAAIEAEVEKIVSVMPVPRATDSESLIRGYVSALQGQSLPAIQKAVEGFLNGRFSPEFSPRWCPMPPELAVMVRRCADEVKLKSGLRSYAYPMPKSEVLEQFIGKEWARTLVNQGKYPRGSIWCPGDADRPDLGTLFGPDPKWKLSRPLDEKPEDRPTHVEDGAQIISFSDRQRLAEVRARIAKKMGVTLDPPAPGAA